MTHTKFTPGPWIVELDTTLTKEGAGKGEPMQDIMANGVPIARTTIYSKLADGYLLASAPDLLAALRDIVREPQGKTVADNAKVLSAVIRIARAALAKAGAA